MTTIIKRLGQFYYKRDLFSVGEKRQLESRGLECADYVLYDRERVVEERFSLSYQ